MSTASQVSKLYQTVVDDVITNVKESFLDESVDEQVLTDLKTLWMTKLAASKALEVTQTEQEQPIQQHVTTMLPIQSTNQHEQIGNQASQSTQQYQLPTNSGVPLLTHGMFHQQLSAVGPDGQVRNITVSQTGMFLFLCLTYECDGQFIALGLPTQQHLTQFQQHSGQLMIQQQHQSLRLPQQQQIRLTQQQQLQLQQQKLLQGQIMPTQGVHQNLIQLDGTADTSSSDDEDFDDDDKEDDEKEDENEEEGPGEEEDPLNSNDDVSEDDPNELFDTDNVVVCQYDKINRNKNKWKFHLKDGIMNLNGKDFVFQKATGDAEW
ncbi:unnamed protein product [Lymnaea stagnalis]|uniref:Transcription initiation factor IIA subunit 1 n=1 Tax=Lymnaea stagnalis TaxID=6523 RepID=A0AAV2HIS6_LYMST